MERVPEKPYKALYFEQNRRIAELEDEVEALREQIEWNWRDEERALIAVRSSDTAGEDGL